MLVSLYMHTMEVVFTLELHKLDLHTVVLHTLEIHTPVLHIQFVPHAFLPPPNGFTAATTTC